MIRLVTLRNRKIVAITLSSRIKLLCAFVQRSCHMIVTIKMQFWSQSIKVVVVVGTGCAFFSFRIFVLKMLMIIKKYMKCCTRSNNNNTGETKIYNTIKNMQRLKVCSLKYFMERRKDTRFCSDFFWLCFRIFFFLLIQLINDVFRILPTTTTVAA